MCLQHSRRRNRSNKVQSGLLVAVLCPTRLSNIFQRKEKVKGKVSYQWCKSIYNAGRRHVLESTSLVPAVVLTRSVLVFEVEKLATCSLDNRQYKSFGFVGVGCGKDGSVAHPALRTSFGSSL